MWFRLALLLLFGAVAVHAASELEGALQLAQAGRYPEARERLEKLVAQEPANPAAWHHLGLVWRARHDDQAYAEAAKAQEKAVELEPNNADYQAEYGRTLMEMASRTRSLSAATKGRDAAERAVALNPGHLDAREGLFQFYSRAPFLAGGSTKKAETQLAEIRRRDPDRAATLEILAKANAKDFNEAFRLCDQLLAKNEANYTVLYQFGRTASVSGRQIERGLACLRKALTLDPPSSTAPTHSHVLFRIGDLEEKSGHRELARQAYTEAVRLDAGNAQAQVALEKLK